MSEEEKEAIEEAISIILRGNDIESAALIIEKVCLDNLIITKGRVDVFKIAVRQVLNFIKEYKNKDYLDIVREKVSANNLIQKQQSRIDKALKFIEENRYTDDNGCGYEWEGMDDIDELVSILRGE